MNSPSDDKTKDQCLSRREFTRAAALVGTGAAASVGGVVVGRASNPALDPSGPASVREIPDFLNLPARVDEDVIIRMTRELRKAMAKPMEDRHWVMVIDQRKCVGCHACTVGCIAENKLPPGVVYRPVIAEESGVFPNVKLKFTPRPCMQCEQPPCVPVCPVNATWRRADGITIIDYDKCIGCRYCLTACPYGARTSDFGEHWTDGVAEGASTDDGALYGPQAPYANQPSHEYGKNWTRSDHDSPTGNARKCQFCLHRLENGQLPVCSTTCIGRANYFGDLNDPDSLVTELLTKNNASTLLPHMGTKPRVFYID